MKIIKGQKLAIDHSRKGKFTAIAEENFCTETDKVFPVVLDAQGVAGIAQVWYRGERIPCRASLVHSISRIE